jgi:hypothetical protein
MLLRHRIVFFSFISASIGLGLVACRSEDATTTPSNPQGQGGSAGTTSAGGSAGTTTQGGSAGTSSTNGTAGTSTNGTAGSQTGGSSGSSGGATDCTGKEATVFSANDMGTALNTKIVLKGVVATSQKFLVSQSKTSGACIWGVFVSAPGLDAVTEYSGIEVTAKGQPAVTDGSGNLGPCPTGADGGPIPDDIQPGDQIDLTAYVTEFPFADFKKTNCTDKGVTLNYAQRQLEVSEKIAQCLAVTKGGGKIPAPKEFSDATEIGQLADGQNTGDINRKWGASLIKLVGPFTPTQPNPGDYGNAMDAVSKFGDIAVTQHSLLVNNTVFYTDLSGGGPKDGSKKYAYPISTSFTSFTGIHFLDFCTWSLSIRTNCGDIDPKAADCP